MTAHLYKIFAADDTVRGVAATLVLNAKATKPMPVESLRHG